VADCFEDEDGRVCALLQKALDKRHCGIDLSPEPAACPCAGLTVGNITWSDAFPTDSCSLTEDGAVDLIASGGGVLLALPNLCVLIPTDGTPDLVRETTPAEGEACIASLRQIAAAEDPPVECSPPI
jgi:hypothetical protein